MQYPSSFGPQPKCRLSLMGIRFMTDPNPAGTGAGGDPANPPAPQDPPKPQDPPAPKDGETPEQTIARLTADNERLEREKTDARVAKEGTLKQEAKRTELLSLAKVLQVEGVEDTDTIETLTEKITGKTLAAKPDNTAELEQIQRTADLRTATVTEAWKQGIAPDKSAYLDFKLGQSTEYKNLDPKSADFGTKLEAVIKSTVASDTVFQAPGGPGGSGGGNHGGSGGGQTVSKEDFDAMTVSDKSKLFQTDRPTFDRLISA